ncbi:MAG TPA: TIGR03435 family protein [Candidatus Acidoferrales bacterium]
MSQPKKLEFRMVPTISVIVLVMGITALLACAARLVRAQSSSSDWQTAAGGKMAFDTVSVKQNLEPYPPEGSPPHSNFPLDSGDAYSLNGGLFSTIKWPLYVYIGFAYKLPPYVNSRVIQQLPKWARANHFDVQARAQGSPTKDQMRLMVQSLLADRFKLAVHTEAQKVPVYELVPDKPGKLGANLSPHSADRPCAMTDDLRLSPTDANAAPFPCGTMSGHFVSGRMHLEGRALTMGQLADYMKEEPGSGLDWPVADHTGLAGTFDFTLEWTPQGPISLNGANAPLDETGPPFVIALKQQLGLKLDATTGLVNVLVIDHVEQPTPN